MIYFQPRPQRNLKTINLFFCLPRTAKRCVMDEVYYILTTTVSIASWRHDNLPWGTPTRKVRWPFSYVVFGDHVINQKHIYTTKIPMTTKHSRVMAYNGELRTIKSHDPVITWSFDVTWQIKILSPLYLHCRNGWSHQTLQCGDVGIIFKFHF